MLSGKAKEPEEFMKLSRHAVNVVRCVLIGALCAVLAACSDPSAPKVDFVAAVGTYQSSGKSGVLRGYGYKFGGEVTGLKQPADAFDSLIAPDGQVLETNRQTLTPDYGKIYGGGAHAGTDGNLTSGQYKAALELLGRTYETKINVDGSEYLDFVSGVTIDSATMTAVSISWEPLPGAKLYEAVLWRIGEPGSVFATTATTYTFEADKVELIANAEYWVSVVAYSKDTRKLATSREVRSSEVESTHFTLSE